MHAAKSYYLYGTFQLFLLSNDPLPPQGWRAFKLGPGGILQRIPHNRLFTLGSVYSTDASGAEQMPETNNSYQT